MGPILSITYGLAVMKMNIVKRGIRNEIVGILISLLVGLIMGACAANVYDEGYMSDEMKSRGKGSISLMLQIIVFAK